MQHLWATTVEAVDIFEKQSLKFGGGNSKWQEFFALVSSLFAEKEGKPKCSHHLNKTKDELKRDLLDLDNELLILQKLQGFSEIVPTIKNLDVNTKYSVIVFEYDTNEVKIHQFTAGEVDVATDLYNSYETKILSQDLQWLVLLVSADSIKKIRYAYRGYFLNVQEFLSEVRKAIK